jgi:hypothetical protein
MSHAQESKKEKIPQVIDDLDLSVVMGTHRRSFRLERERELRKKDSRDKLERITTKGLLERSDDEEKESHILGLQ